VGGVGRLVFIGREMGEPCVGGACFPFSSVFPVFPLPLGKVFPGFVACSSKEQKDACNGSNFQLTTILYSPFFFAGSFLMAPFQLPSFITHTYVWVVGNGKGGMGGQGTVTLVLIV
jgi:hypothetical protein